MADWVQRINEGTANYNTYFAAVTENREPVEDAVLEAIVIKKPGLVQLLDTEIMAKKYPTVAAQLKAFKDNHPTALAILNGRSVAVVSPQKKTEVKEGKTSPPAQGILSRIKGKDDPIALRKLLGDDPNEPVGDELLCVPRLLFIALAFGNGIFQRIPEKFRQMPSIMKCAYICGVIGDPKLSLQIPKEFELNDQFLKGLLFSVVKSNNDQVTTKKLQKAGYSREKLEQVRAASKPLSADRNLREGLEKRDPETMARFFAFFGAILQCGLRDRNDPVLARAAVDALWLNVLYVGPKIVKTLVLELIPKEKDFHLFMLEGVKDEEGRCLMEDPQVLAAFGERDGEEAVGQLLSTHVKTDTTTRRASPSKGTSELKESERTRRRGPRGSSEGTRFRVAISFEDVQELNDIDLVKELLQKDSQAKLPAEVLKYPRIAFLKLVLGKDVEVTAELGNDKGFNKFAHLFQIHLRPECIFQIPQDLKGDQKFLAAVAGAALSRNPGYYDKLVEEGFNETTLKEGQKIAAELRTSKKFLKKNHAASMFQARDAVAMRHFFYPIRGFLDLSFQDRDNIKFARAAIGVYWWNILFVGPRVVKQLALELIPKEKDFALLHLYGIPDENGNDLMKDPELIAAFERRDRVEEPVAEVLQPRVSEVPAPAPPVSPVLPAEPLADPVIEMAPVVPIVQAAVEPVLPLMEEAPVGVRDESPVNNESRDIPVNHPPEPRKDNSIYGWIRWLFSPLFSIYNWLIK